MFLPKARQDKLTVRQLADETLVFDHLTSKAHCLNLTAGLVWKHCDGKTTVRQLAGLLQRELGVPASEALVHLALEQLARRRLLEPLPAESAEVRQSRRRMLRKVALVWPPTSVRPVSASPHHEVDAEVAGQFVDGHALAA